MPKSRGSSIANRSGDVTYDEREMSDRVQDRIDDVGPIDVFVESSSRRRRERMSVSFSTGGGADVGSASGMIYHVDMDEGTCTCPDYIHRQGHCRHMEATDLAREQRGQGTRIGSNQDEGVTGSEFTGERQHYETQAELQIADADRRQRADDAFFYTQNQEQFLLDMRAAANAPIPYEYENALNGSSITFGIELEFVGGDSNAIAAELYTQGLCGSNRMERYHSHSRPGMWKVEQDGSVTQGTRGGEIISPILTDTPETWRQIETVCSVAKRHGARINQKTGGHVHVGAEEMLDGKRQRWRRFFKTTAGFESVYHRLAGGELGKFRGGDYARSSIEQNSEGVMVRMPEDGPSDVFAGIIRRISRGKYQSINLKPFEDKKTVEFRAFNGTLTPGIIQANVKYAAGVIKTSERSRTEYYEGVEVTEADRTRGRLINDYERNNTRDDSGMMRALDVIFSRQEDKKHIMAVLARNSWG